MVLVQERDKQRPREATASGADRSRPKIAYMMSRFPKLTETFILFEMLAVEEENVDIEVYPLLRERTSVMHAEAAPIVASAHFTPFVSPAIVRSHLYFLRYRPRTYLRTLWTLLRANWGSLRYFGGAVVYFPKAVYLAQQMQNAGIEHIHAHFASHPAAVAYTIYQLTGIPFSFTAHGSDLHRDRHMLCEKVEAAAFTVTISAYNKRVILDECGEAYRDKIKIIHCGVDTATFRPQFSPSENGRSEKPFKILCIGTLHEVKGQRYLIEACRHLQERGLDFECHFVGDGPDEAILKEQVQQAGLDGRIHFEGRCTREQVLEFLQRADVVAAPSVPTSSGRREGIPVALMEAMSVANPVVASDLSGIPELVDHNENGLLIRPGDARGLAEALEQLYHDPALCRRLGAAGREKIVREFDLHRNASRLIDYIEEGIRT